MIEELRLVAARWTLGLLKVEELPGIAERALESGADSPALAELAMQQGPTLRVGGPLLEQALKDLGIPRPDLRAAGDALAGFYALRIVEGDVSPYEGAARIWHEVYERLDGPAELADFRSAASEIEDYRFVQQESPGRYEGRIAEAEERIVALSRELLARLDTPP